MNVIIYCDMDGVIYPWNESASIEDTFMPGYFNQNKEQLNMVKCLQRLSKNGYDVRILSAVYPDQHVVNDKSNWLHSHGLGMLPRFFVPYNVGSKRDITDPTCVNILIDDFTNNLKTWTNDHNKNYIGIKFFNQVNTKKGFGSWYGPAISYQMNADELYFMISALADKLINEERSYNQCF